MSNKTVLAVALATGMIATSTRLIAREYTFSKQVDPGTLQQELIEDGFKVSHIECVQQRCKIVMPDTERKDPSGTIAKHVYADQAAMRKRRIQELRSLHAKWEAKTISLEEKDFLLKSIIADYLGK